MGQGCPGVSHTGSNLVGLLDLCQVHLCVGGGAALGDLWSWCGLGAQGSLRWVTRLCSPLHYYCGGET